MGAQLSSHVEQRLDELAPYQTAVKATFSQFAKGAPEGVGAGDSAGDAGWDATAQSQSVGRGEAREAAVQEAQLLSAAQALIKMLAEEMDEHVSQVVLREPTKGDCEAVLRTTPGLVLPLRFHDYERFQRGIVKRVAVDQGRRLLAFVAGGIVAVHVVKRTLRKVPFLGAPVVALVNAFLPTPVLGSALGVAGALYIEQAHKKRIT